jgi:hypothetical protein
VLTQNNKKLAASIGLKYEEYQDLDQKSFLCSLKIINCSYLTQDNHLNNNYDMNFGSNETISNKTIKSKASSNLSNKTVVKNSILDKANINNIRRQSLDSLKGSAVPKREKYSSKQSKSKYIIIL